jgi:hypothetical protein
MYLFIYLEGKTLARPRLVSPWAGVMSTGLLDFERQHAVSEPRTCGSILHRKAAIPDEKEGSVH